MQEYDRLHSATRVYDLHAMINLGHGAVPCASHAKGMNGFRQILYGLKLHADGVARMHIAPLAIQDGLGSEMHNATPGT